MSRGFPIADALRAAAVAGLVAVLVLPLPTWLIDLLLAGNLAGAVVLLLVVAGSRRPAQLTGFPAVLLGLTIARLATNVATTRSILARGEAGQLVQAFGDAVVSGDVVVGLVVFAVVTIAQYLVIARGAERVAEVSARFALDALPGLQMGIEAEVRGGRLDREGARVRRAALEQRSGLHGAMDGAMRFVRGDAIAGLVIVGINIAGGLTIGVGRLDLPLGEAAATYTLLTVGDGLIAQVPAVLSAAAAALLATRLAAGARPAAGQFLRRPALLGGAALFAGLAALPGLPALPLVVVAIALAGFAWLDRRPLGGAPLADGASSALASAGEPHVATLHIHPVAIEALGHRTVESVIDEAARTLGRRFGVALPPVHITEAAPELVPGGYRLDAGEAVVGVGQLVPAMVFCCPPPAGVDGYDGRHPVHSAPGRWVPSGPGLDPAQFLCAHLVSLWRRAGSTALGVQAVAERVAALERTAPALVGAVVPRRADLPRLTRLLQRLLAEGLSAHPLPSLFEALSALEPGAAEEAQLAALRRQRAGELAARLAPAGRLATIHAAADLEGELRSDGALDAGLSAALVEQLDRIRRRHPQAVWVVGDRVRLAARAAVADALPGLAVLAAGELAPSLAVYPVGVVDGDG